MKPLLIGLAIGLVAGLGGGYALYHRATPTVTEKPGAEILLPGPGGGRVVAEQPAAEPLPVPQGLPRGSRVVRRVEVTVQPNPQPPSALPGAAIPALAPVKVILSLVRQEDNTLRVVATAEGGTVVGAIDVPLEGQPITAAPPAPKKLLYSAGAVYGTTAWGDTAKGLYLDRDFAFMRGGVEITRNAYAVAGRTGWEVRAKIGIRF